MTDGKRIGVLSSGRNAVRLDEALSGRLTATPLDGGTLEETLSHYQAINVRTVVVDDDLLYGHPEAEEVLARWAKTHGHPRVRIILFMDSGRPTDDPYLYRLVSDAEVHDILVAEENGEPETRLLHLIDEPMAPMEYERWRTNDPGVWQQRKPGFFESLLGGSKKNEKKKKGKKSKKGKQSSKQKKSKARVEQEALPEEPSEETFSDYGAPHEQPQAGQEPVVEAKEKVVMPERPATSASEHEPMTELGDVTSVYGIELDDEEGEEPNGEGTKDEEMREKNADAEEKKRVELDLGADAPTRAMPKVEVQKGEAGKAPSEKGAKAKKDVEGQGPAKGKKGSKPVSTQEKTERNKEPKVANEQRRAEPTYAEPMQDSPVDDPKAVVREVVETVVEDVRAQATASPAPGTVTLTFPGSSLSSILESFVRPGAERRQGVSFPTAKNVVAVSSLRPGMGCSHVSVALGVALASEHVSVAVALRTRFNVSRMLDGLSDSYETNGVGVKWRGCDFYYWEDQRRFASEYDVVIADCGVLEASDNSRNSPTNLFVNHARVSLLLMGGSPWDLPLLDGVLPKFDARTTREWRFGCCRTTSEMLASLEETFANIYHDGRKRMWPVPYSPSLFDGSTPRFAAYRELLEPVLPKSLRYSKAQTKVEEDAPEEERPVEAGPEQGRTEEPKAAQAKKADAPEPKPEKDGNRPDDGAKRPDSDANPEGSPESAPEDQQDKPTNEKKTRKRPHNKRHGSDDQPAGE